MKLAPRVVGVCGVLMLFGAALVHAADQPNLVIFYADDLGWGESGCLAARTFRRRISIRWRLTACASRKAMWPRRIAAPRGPA